MPLANFLAMALGLVTAAIGVLGLTAPSTLLEFGRSLQSAVALYVVSDRAARIRGNPVLGRTGLTFAADLRILGGLIGLAVRPSRSLASSGLAPCWTGGRRRMLRRANEARSNRLLGLVIAYCAVPRPSGTMTRFSTRARPSRIATPSTARGCHPPTAHPRVARPSGCRDSRHRLLPASHEHARQRSVVARVDLLCGTYGGT